MRMGDDYSPAGGGELADFGTYLGVGGGPTRWGSAQGGPTWGRSTPQHHHTSRFQTTSTNNCYEAEDIMYGAEHTRSCPTGSLRGRSGLYYSPPGTSYTIVERPSSTMGMHHHRDREYIQQYNKMAAASPRGTYLGASTTAVQSTRASSSAAVANTINKKRPISPEQVLKMFGNGHPASANHTTSSSKVVPAATTGTRRSPASSPASTTHQVYGAGGASVARTGGAATGVYPSPQISIHELSTRTVTMTREPADGTHGFGICVKGGKDAGVGVYISRVEEGSVAERAGLRPGDSILEVNGTPFTAISHEEALKMLKSCRKLSMTVRSPTLPGTAAAASALGAGSYVVRQTCSWMDRQGRPVSPPIEYRRARPPPGGPGTGAVRRVDLCIEPGQSLGLMIRGGVEYNLGIFITGVDKESVADRAGLLIGDQILEVNGQSFLDVTHDEAVSQLKYHKRMSLLVRDVGKVPHSCTAYDHRGVDMIWEPLPGASRYGTVSGRNRSAALQMVEEKARTVLPKSDFPTLCYYTDEYTCRRMTVDAFVVVMLELLNTPEKYTLLTELREIIAPEDRVRFDELVYRREGDTRTRDIQREYDVRHSSRRKTGISLAENNHSMLMSSLHDMAGPDYTSGDETEATSGRRSRRHSSPGDSCSGSATALHQPDYDEDTDQSGYLGGLRSWTQKVKSWYWGRPLELAHKLSRSFDMKDDQNMLEASGASADSGGANGSGAMRRHQSMQRLSRSGESGTGAGDAATDADSSAATIIPDQHGNLRITVKKSKPILGIAIEGGANTKHPLPRIINIHENGAAFDAGGLEVGQLILEVDGARVEGMQHQEVARLIAESFARRDRNIIEFLVVEAKKSNMEPKPTALIFLEA